MAYRDYFFSGIGGDRFVPVLLCRAVSETWIEMRPKVTKAMTRPRSLEGIVTSTFGKTDFLPDGSFVTTQWLSLCMIPIIPLGSFRVIKSKRYPKHHRICEPTPVNAKQIALVYLFMVLCACWLLFAPVLMSEYLLDAPVWVFLTVLLFGLPVPAILPWLARRNAPSKVRSQNMLVRQPSLSPVRASGELTNQARQLKPQRARTSRLGERAPGFSSRPFLPRRAPRIASEPRP